MRYGRPSCGRLQTGSSVQRRHRQRVDSEDELHGGVFEPLRDARLFKQVAVNEETNTIEWSNGADFAPEFLYRIGKEVK